MAEYDDVMRVLMANADKQFVQRILQPTSFPVLKNQDGSVSTHKMAWSEKNGKFYVHPTILYDGKKLTDYGDNAFDRAYKSGNVIEFKTPEEADRFSRNYKAAWGQ